MQRRDFCKSLVMAATSTAIPGLAQAAQGDQLRPPDGFNRYTMDYAQFCALPPEKRVFYRLSGDRIVEAKPDDAVGKPIGVGRAKRAAHPGRIVGRRADGVTDPESCGRGPVQTYVGFAARVRRAGVVPRREVRHLGPLEPAVRARSRRLVRAQYVRRGPAAIQVSPRTLRAALALRIQGSLRAVDAAELGTRRTHRALQEGRRAGFSLRSPIITTASTRGTRSISRGTPPRLARIAMWSAHGLPPRASRDCASGSRCIRRATGGGSRPSHGADKSGPLAGVPYDGELTASGGRDQWWLGSRSAAPLRREAPARRTTRHLLRQELLRPNARPDRSAQSRPALLRQFAAAAGLGRHEHRRVLLQPLPAGPQGAGWKRF